ncbi:p21-C-terminal region-binding protein-domain-containing protein [Microdochium trichocladiopsis]|uniref:Protein BCP1 n=1 Tax=Microdochium trichocladiopsis TaxID=1682393 RepID=A0A9P8Y982_9PEZI|nr:p21-C-terminal region-binding protein-domain-containing protein [Microdochium trichocladiopsis]KAH7031281.1 p21-C-terminal region-binding protein-domain-containing protein [Microdochium trichocladiopsis]
MAKKRAREADGATGPSEKMAVDGAESSDDEDFDMVNVEFEWFNFDADIDFHGTKALLRQLLDVDASLHDISGLADLILSQPTVGSTVKVDGKETDPYAMLTALNLREHAGNKGNKAVVELVRYLADKAASSSSTGKDSSSNNNNNNNLASVVPELLQAQTSNSGGQAPTVGLILAERLINMPAEISPPMYRMVIDEIADAVEDKEPYEFTHYLVLSKTYQEVEGKKRGRQDPTAAAAAADTTWYFHPEDEVLHRYAAAHGSYSFTKHDESIADSKRAFQEMGIRPQGHMILIEAGRFAEAVKAISDYLAPPS